jgi:hypothetical protein
MQLPARACGAVIRAAASARFPTAFWNKDDSPNYDRFIETARLFDPSLTSSGLATCRVGNHAPHLGAGIYRRVLHGLGRRPARRLLKNVGFRAGLAVRGGRNAAKAVERRV